MAAQGYMHLNHGKWKHSNHDDHELLRGNPHQSLSRMTCQHMNTKG
jgi:hypothetical protein